MALLIQSVLMQALIIHGRPLSEPLENLLSLFNEFMVTLYMYLMITLTDYNQKENPLRH